MQHAYFVWNTAMPGVYPSIIVNHGLRDEKDSPARVRR
jgi:hypothetical protein